MLYCVIVISKQNCHIYFKKWDNESDFAFCNPKRHENYLNI